MLKKTQHYKNIILEKTSLFSIKTIGFIVLGICCVYFLIWTILSKQLGNKIITVIEQMRDKKINITIEDYHNIGFPNYFATILDTVKYRNAERNFGWKTSKIIIYPPLFDANTVTIDLPNDYIFSINSNLNKMVKRIGVRSDICKINLDYYNKKLNVINLKSNHGTIHISDPKQTYAYHNLIFSMKNAHILLDEKLEDIIEMNLDIHNIEPPKLWKNILEDNFSYFKANIYLRNPNQMSSLPDFQKFIMRDYDLPELIIDKAVLMHYLSKFTLSGILTFDSDMKLNGDITLTISNYQKLLKFLTKKGVLSPEIAANFRFMLSFLLSTKTLQKNTGAVDIPLTLKKNVLYRGDIRLFDITL